MEKLTSTAQLLFFKLRYKRDYFQQRSMLADDGSFYGTDKIIAEEIGKSTKTVERSIKQLVDFNLVKVIRGCWKKSPTKYWIIGKLEKGVPTKSTVKVDISSTFESIVKADKILVKGDKIVSKDRQNVLYNKDINNEINNERADEIIEIKNFTQEQKDGIKATLTFWSKAQTKNLFLKQNYNESELDALLQEY